MTVPRGRSILQVVGLACLVSQGCSTKPESAGAQAPPSPPAKVDHRVSETDLTRITLTPEAEKRLGIQVAEAVPGDAANVSTVAGEVLMIPGKILIAQAPVAGTLHSVREIQAGRGIGRGEPIFRLTPVIGPQRDLKITYEADIDSARSRLDAATLQLQRARQLLRDLAGSQKNVEAAEQQLAQERTAFDAAVKRLEQLKAYPLEGDVDMAIVSPGGGIVRQVYVAEGQKVAAGAALFEVADLGRLWLRVPVYAADSDMLERQSSVTVRNVNGEGPARRAVRVAAPPTADPAAVTVDLYFELDNSDGQLRPGQKLNVTLPPSSTRRTGMAVPAAALLYDIQGGSWVYVLEAPQTYRRQRVELIQIEGPSAILSRGLSAGTRVVTAGAAELFGTEFGAGK